MLSSDNTNDSTGRGQKVPDLPFGCHLWDDDVDDDAAN
jgi:hypothetical protein